VYSRQCGQKDRGDLAATKVPSRKDEHPRVACSQGAHFQRAIPQSLILGEHNPTALSDGLKPDAIFFVASEMIVMNLDHET
jgi:hypothetical protein